MRRSTPVFRRRQNESDLACNFEELDIKVLQFQHKKLVERLSVRNEIENELWNQIEVLQQRQATNEAVLSLMDKYGMQLEGDIKIVFRRFKAHLKITVKQEEVILPPNVTDQTKDGDGIEPTGDATEGKKEGQSTGVKTCNSNIEDSKPISMDISEDQTEDKMVTVVMEEEEDDKHEPEELASFLIKFSSYDQNEIKAKLADILKFSKEALDRLIEMFCRLKEDQEKANTCFKDKAYFDCTLKELHKECQVW